MVHKKTGWYTFVAPIVAGATIAGADPALAGRLGRFGALAGVGFQIQDDVLNLTGAEARTGKERMGDIWEGKYTLMLLHLMRGARADEARRLGRILAKRRPPSVAFTPGAAAAQPDRAAEVLERLRGVLSQQVRLGALSAQLAAAIEHGATTPERESYRTQEDVDEVFAMMERHGSVRHARAVARRYAVLARRELDKLARAMPPSVHRDFLAAVVDYVVERDH